MTVTQLIICFVALGFGTLLNTIMFTKLDNKVNDLYRELKPYKRESSDE